MEKTTELITKIYKDATQEDVDYFVRDLSLGKGDSRFPYCTKYVEPIHRMAMLTHFTSGPMEGTVQVVTYQMKTH